MSYVYRNQFIRTRKKILTRLSLVVKRLDKEKQNYILGYAEGMAANKKEKSEECEKIGKESKI